jgi:hypothetical protein
MGVKLLSNVFLAMVGDSPTLESVTNAEAEVYPLPTREASGRVEQWLSGLRNKVSAEVQNAGRA